MKMVRSILVCAVMAFAVIGSGCAAFQQKIDHDVDQQLALTLPDLDAASAAAVAHNDPNPMHKLCWDGLATAIRAQIAAEPPPPPAGTAPVGLASAAEDFLMTDVQPIVIHLPPLPADVRTACYSTIGELRVKATVDALKFSAAITATIHKLKL